MYIVTACKCILALHVNVYCHHIFMWFSSTCQCVLTVNFSVRQCIWLQLQRLNVNCRHMSVCIVIACQFSSDINGFSLMSIWIVSTCRCTLSPHPNVHCQHLSMHIGQNSKPVTRLVENHQNLTQCLHNSSDFFYKINI